MAKKTEITEIENEVLTEISTQKNEVVRVELEQSENVNLDIFDASALDNIDALEPGKINLSKKYLDLEIGQVIRGIFFGFGIFVNEDKKEFKTVELITKDLGLVFTASNVIVNSLNNAKKGQAFEIHYTGIKSLGGGRKLKEYEVYQLS